MNEAQVRLIKSGSSVAKIHSHPCEVCAVCVWPAGTWWLWWLRAGRTTRLRAVKFVSCINAVKHTMVCVCARQLGYSSASHARTMKSPLLRASVNAQQSALVRRCHREHRETSCTACLSIWESTFWFHRGDVQRQKPDDCGMSRSRAVWFLWVAEGALGSQSSPSAVLEDPLQRAGSSPAEVQRLAHSSPSVSPLRPHLKLSGQPPRGKMPAALLGSQLRITHQFIKAACQWRPCWVDT